MALAALGATPTASAAMTPKPMTKTVSATALAQAGIRLQPPTSSAVVSQAAAQQPRYVQARRTRQAQSATLCSPTSIT
jgi:hypothetical protein